MQCLCFTYFKSFTLFSFVGTEGTANKDNQWLGVSVVSEGPGGSVAVSIHCPVKMGTPFFFYESMKKYYEMTRDDRVQVI